VNRFSLTPAARRDLKSIWLYIAMDSVHQAELVEDAIYETCRFAANNPEVGHPRPDVANPGIRFLTVSAYKKYVIAYASGSKSLRVIRILHGAQNIKSMFR